MSAVFAYRYGRNLLCVECVEAVADKGVRAIFHEITDVQELVRELDGITAYGASEKCDECDTLLHPGVK